MAAHPAPSSRLLHQRCALFGPTEKGTPRRTQLDVARIGGVAGRGKNFCADQPALRISVEPQEIRSLPEMNLFFLQASGLTVVQAIKQDRTNENQAAPLR